MWVLVSVWWRSLSVPVWHLHSHACFVCCSLLQLAYFADWWKGRTWLWAHAARIKSKFLLVSTGIMVRSQPSGGGEQGRRTSQRGIFKNVLPYKLILDIWRVTWLSAVKERLKAYPCGAKEEMNLWVSVCLGKKSCWENDASFGRFNLVSFANMWMPRFPSSKLSAK